MTLKFGNIGGVQRDAIIQGRRARVAQLYLSGMPMREIADLLQINKNTLTSDMVELRKEWKETRQLAMNTIMEEQLAKIDRTEQCAWDGWERSCQPAKTTTQSESPTGKLTTKMERKEQCGDPRFLAVIQNAIKQRRELLGLDAPQKTESTVTATVTHYQPPPTRDEVGAAIAKLRERIHDQSKTTSVN